MLILYNGEVLTNVSSLRNSDNSVACLEHLGWRFYKSQKANISGQQSVPCIYFPKFSKDRIWEKCEIGYLDTDSLEFTPSKIVLDHMVIRQIEVRRETGTGGPKTRHGCVIGVDYSEYFYKIEISFYSDDHHGFKTAYHPSVIFQSYDIIYKDCSEGERRKYSRTMRYLFVEFPEIINDYLEGNEQDHYFYDRPLSLLNFNLLQKGWPNKETYEYPTYSCMTASHEYLFDRNDKMDLPYTLEKALITLHSTKVDKSEDEVIVKFSNDDSGYLNIYFERFFEFAFGQQLLYDKKTRIAYCHFNKSNIPFELSSNEDIAAYIACVMHLYLYKYFDLEASRELYLVSIPQETSEYDEISTYLTKMEKIDIEEQFYDIYRFMFCCKIEHKQEGQHRVGRDDCESMFKTYEFRPRKGHLISKSLIKKINSLLNTKLKYEEEESGWNGHPERYSYCNVYSHEYFYGWAESQDLGSVYLQNASFMFISNYFIMEYLTDKEDFKRFLI